MDNLSKLKKKLINREMVFMPILAAAFAGAAGAIKAGGADCVMIDTEHTPTNAETLHAALTHCRQADLPTVVRVPDALYHLISQVYDFGADGIMVPRVQTTEQVERAIKAAKFPPVGEKGCGGPGIFRKGESTEDFNRNRIVLLQIESALGIESRSEMLDEYGAHIDGVVAGPTDLSISLGVPMQYGHELVERELEKMISVCEKYRKPCGMYMGSLDEARRWQEKGMTILWVSSVMEFVREGTATILEKLRGEQ